MSPLPQPPLTSLTVLLVDDSDDICRMFEAYFQGMGIRVVIVTDGVSALDAAGYESPDAIVLDLSIPKMTGWDVMRNLKQEPWTRRIPVVVLSGLDERESALEAGADSYLAKPCLPHDLLAEVLRLIRWAGPAPTDNGH